MVHLNDTVRLPDPENREMENTNSAQLSFTVTKLYRFEVSIGRNAIFF